MKTVKTVLSLAIVGAFLSTGVIASEALTSPRAAKHPSISSAAKDADYVRDASALGNAAKSKAQGSRVIASSSKADPNLLGCYKIGKGVCSKNPCDGKMLAACCPR